MTKKMKIRAPANINQINEENNIEKWRIKINYLNKREKGITLISLVITVIILLILASITISTLSGDNGILTNGAYAKFATEVKGIEEQVGLKLMQIEDEENYFSSINETLETLNKYDNKLLIQQGKVVYDSNNVSQQEKEWLKN